MQEKALIEAEFLIVGSSPICLIEALYLAHLGKKVIIIEKNNYLGGSWQTINIGKLTNLDAGCHIITRKEDAYAFLSNYLGVNMQKLAPHPFRAIGFKRYGYESAGFQFNLFNQKLGIFFQIISKYFTRQPFQGQLISTQQVKKALKDIINLGKSSVRRSILPAKEYRYPKQGANEIVHNLQQLLVKQKVPIFLNTKIESVKINQQAKNGLALVEASNQAFQFQQLIMTSGSEIATIHSNTKTVSLTREERVFRHICLVIKDNQGENISYGHFWDNPILERINEYSHIANYPVDNCRIFMILLNPKYQIQETDKISEEILSILTRFNIIGKNAKLLDANLIKQSVPFRGKDVMKEIGDKFSPIIQPLYSTNLAISIEMNMERWSNVLPKIVNISKIVATI